MLTQDLSDESTDQVIRQPVGHLASWCELAELPLVWRVTRSGQKPKRVVWAIALAFEIAWVFARLWEHDSRHQKVMLLG